MRFENPPVPFSTPVHHIRDGSEIEIHGMAFDGAVGSFAVELFVGNDIALHLNPRQKHHGNTIVLNSMVMGQWQHEERHHGPIHHFHHNKHFHLKIIVHQHHFKIKVNDHKICEFHHRMPYHMINMIGIRNDVVVHKIHLHNVGEGYGAPMPGYVQPMPIGSGVAPQPYIGGGVVPPPVYAPPPTVYMPPQPVMAYGAQPSVVVIEEGHRHHHHGHHHHHHW